MPLTAEQVVGAALLIGSISLFPLDHSGVRQEPASLTGRWEARFVLTRSSRLPFPTLAREVSGEIRFSPAAPPPLAQDAATWRLVYPGTAAVDFLPLGFKLGNAEALGWHATPDTVRIILDPTVDHGGVEVVGTGTGNDLSGRWELISDLARAEGHFTLRRIE